jgi:hypothetical protein
VASRHLLATVDYEFLEPWDLGRCQVRVRDRIADVRHYYVLSDRYFVAKINGVDTKPYRRFMDLLRALAKEGP